MKEATKALVIGGLNGTRLSASPALWLYIATRTIGLAPLLLPGGEEALAGLISSYQAYESLGPAQASREYPWLMTALMHLPLSLGVSSQMQYMGAWLQIALVIDALFVSLLWRAGGGRMTPGLLLWLLVLPALGPMLLGMFDLLPAVAAACALFALSQARHRLAGVSLAIGTAMKLWPIAGLAALTLAAAKRDRVAIFSAFACVGLVLAIATLATGGPARLLSPLLWQYHRGLQVEAVAALPLLWARHLAGEDGWRWTTSIGPFNCFEVFGPGVDIALLLNSVAMLLATMAVAILHLRALRAPPEKRTAALAARLFLISVLAVVLTSKVFSPQYLIWIAALLAALGTLRGARFSRLDGTLFLVACAFTQIVFPFYYEGLVLQGYTRTWVLAVLTLRDLLLAALCVRLGAQAWRAAARWSAAGAPAGVQ